MCHSQRVFGWNLEKRTKKEKGRNSEKAKVKFSDRKKRKIQGI